MPEPQAFTDETLKEKAKMSLFNRTVVLVTLTMYILMSPLIIKGLMGGMQ